jgi:hypothetical protein
MNSPLRPRQALAFTPEFRLDGSDRVFRGLAILTKLVRRGWIACAAWKTPLACGKQRILRVEPCNGGPKRFVFLIALVSAYFCFDCETILMS